MINIYLDLDGVFADFDTYWSKRLVQLGATGNLDIDDRDRELFFNEVADRKLFEQLDFMPSSNALLSVLAMVEKSPLVNVEFLTASGMDNSSHVARAAQQKKNWLIKNSLFYKPNIVGRKVHKQLYVKSSDDIIVDDSRTTVDAWRKNGGTAVLWDSSNPTKSAIELRDILIEKGVI